MCKDKIHKEVMEEMGKSFQQFFYTGHWGDCEECPCMKQLGVDHRIPERCVNALRDDHLRPPSELFEEYEAKCASIFYKQSQR